MPETFSDAVAAAIRRLLSQHGPMLEADLVDALRADNVDLGLERDESLVDVLDDQAGLMMPLVDGRWAWLPALAAGRVFTHRLNAVEAEHDLIDCEPDLTPLLLLPDDETYHSFTDGSPVIDLIKQLDAELLAERGVPESALGGDSVLLLEVGRFAALGVMAGDLIEIRVTDDGFEFGVPTELTTYDLAAPLTALLADDPDRPVELDLAVWTACAADDSLFRQATAPLGELLDAGGFARYGDWIAPGGFDFVDWRLQSQIAGIKRSYDLADNEAFEVFAVVSLYDQLVEFDPEPRPRTDVEPDRTIARATLEYLVDPLIADAVLTHVSIDELRGGLGLGIFAELVEPLASRAASPAVRWLRAKAYELDGEIEQAEQAYGEAESLDPSWPLTLLDLARYASDRGDAERGLALLRRAGVSRDYELVHILERFQTTPREGLGRNQPCWCGSGRKYKACHLHREQLPLEERAAWLYRKAAFNLQDGPFRPMLMDAAEARSAFWNTPDAFERATEDDLVCDVTLFEGGAFEDFVARRGSLLPADELSLAEQWLLVERSVYDVISVRRGQSITVRDVRTGDVHEVRERAGSRQVKHGELYCLRVLPAGETMQLFGGLEPVSLGERDYLIELLDDEEADPAEIVDFLSRRFAPPVLQNTEGEALAQCRATLRIAAPVELVKALDEAYERNPDRPDGTLSWFEHVTTHGMERVRASLTLSGDELRIEANSEARFDRVLATIAALDPSMTVVDESREPAGDLRAAKQLLARNPPKALADPADPAIAAVLDDYVRKYEASWLDESIPALGGRTPRECAADPTRRDDLIRLLDSFPADDGQPATMSAARLRQALGLG